nr:P3 protein [Grapevine associated jivivirus 1]
MSPTASPQRSSAIDAMDKYHAYLENNYVGGCERFFSPTGFLSDFQKTIEVQTQDARNHVFARTIDEAQKFLEPVVAGGEGVFDLTAEPGTGKTSTLPFRFPSKIVVVALPSPFDAWSAFQMATGKANLKLQGLSLGPSDAKVTYTDSYLAAKAVLSGYLKYDVLIVDECDSPRGVIRFLAEIKAPGKLLVRMSASHGRVKSTNSKSFRVNESNTLPDVQKDPGLLAKFVSENHKNRSLLLVPDAQCAIEMGKLIPSSKVVCTKSNLGDIARAIVNQEGNRLYIADDTCARGLNLNLDVVFDCQQVTENGTTRNLTAAELYQRKGRVGRNKDGWYFSPGLPVIDLGTSDVDVLRHNVVRAVAGTSQVGSRRLHVTQQDLSKLLCASTEPYMEMAVVRAEQERARHDVAVTSSPSSSDTSFKSPTSSRSHSRTSSVRSGSSVVSKVSAPSWVFHFASGTFPGKKTLEKNYVVSYGKGKGESVRHRKSSSSSGGDSISLFRGSVSSREPAGKYDRSLLPSALDAPYAAPRRSERPAAPQVRDLPHAPPTMDLTQLTYDLDWPALIRDRLVNGGDLPTVVPPNNWRHTSSGGLGNDWLKRLDDVALTDSQFTEGEFETICRAWNKLVALAWVKKTPGLSNYSNFDRMEYCVRYFQSYFLLASAD